MKSYLRAVALAGLAGLSALQASAQPAYPNRPIRMVVGFAPGGSVDTAARIVAESLGTRLGQQVVVDNRPGASGLLAGDLVARAEPDGYTLLFSSNGALTINPHFMAKPPFDPVTGFAPISRIARVDALLVVSPKVPANTFAEFIALVRREPGKYSFASSGTGGPTHLAGELLKQQAHLDMVHIPYKGDAPAMVDLMSGVVPVAIPVVPSVGKFIQAGKVKALASFGEKRSAAFPDLPTIAESGYPGFAAGAWYAIVAPTRTPRAAVQRLSREIDALLKDPAVVSRMETAGMEPFDASPAETGAYIQQEYTKWGTVIREANIQTSGN